MAKKSTVGSPSRTAKHVNATVREELCNADLRKFADLLAKAIKQPPSTASAGGVVAHGRTRRAKSR
jgi:hypothetical protein